ncbi:DUF4046 domain-containing protein [Bacillus cereus group sp. BfR-BA-01331]|uniref:DUF4046 domain-containing protein n=1 Tax=Bacillus cereus group sp. BfR-BA-01331 TaxID=2920307 RepID=UPI001F57DF08|nr:DUF4046 domain-containing protein [Bacillus cereus group sp. BfR-BA-01331]
MQMKAISIEGIYQEILDGKKTRFPANTWKNDVDKEMARRITKYLIEIILKWDEEEIKQNWNTPLIINYRLRGLLNHQYENSPYKMIDDLYPNRFKEWDFGMTSLNFWNKEKALEVLKWIIEEKEKLSEEGLLEFYNKKWLEKNKLGSPLVMYWNGSPYAMINDLYPNRFKEWELKVTPAGYWKENSSLEALRWIIEEKEKLTEEQLLNVYSQRWLINKKLWTPLKRFWNGSPYEMLNALYPGRFSKEMLKGYSKK